MDVFNSCERYVKLPASQMFGVPVEEIHKGTLKTGARKDAELALGYGGSKGAFPKAMGAIL